MNNLRIDYVNYFKKSTTHNKRCSSAQNIQRIFLLGCTLTGIIIATSIYIILSSISQALVMLNISNSTHGTSFHIKNTSSTRQQSSTLKFNIFTLLHTSNSTFLDMYRMPHFKKQISTINYYFIQTGTFRKQSGTDKIRAKLTLTGFNTKCEITNLSSGDAWLQVFIGPFNSENQASNQKKLLEVHKIHDTLVLKRHE